MSRTGVDGATAALYTSQRFDTHERIKVKNGSGTFVDLSLRWTGYNLQFPQPNLPIGALTVDFARDASPSLSPMVTASTLNRLDDGVTFSPLLEIGRTVTFEIALTAVGGARPAGGSSLWYEVFRGTIAKPAWPQYSSHTISISVLDLGGVLQKTKSETAYTYTAGTAIETVAQQILNNHGLTWVSFSCPVATGKVLPNDVAPGLQKTVWEQLANLARQSGLVLWFRYSGASTLQLVMFEPARSKTVPDQTFNFVHDFSQLEEEESEISSAVYVVYFDANGVQQTTAPFVSSASIARYGGEFGMRRPSWIVLTADSPVRSGIDAGLLGAAALSDVADPDVIATATLPPLWFGESAVDLYQFPVHTAELFDTPLPAAPFSITIQRNADQQPTCSVNVRGKPSAGRKTWQVVGGGTIITSYGLNGSSMLLPDVIDSFQLGSNVPYISGGGATDAWPRRPFTVNTESDLTTWSLGGLFKEDVGNVAANGPQGLENYMRFLNTNTISGPNLGIISNAEMAGAGGTVVGWKAFAAGFVMNANAATVSGKVVGYDCGGVSRVGGATGVFSGDVIGFRGSVPASHAAVTGLSWNLYMDGTAPNYLVGRLYMGSLLSGTAWMERNTSSGSMLFGGDVDVPLLLRVGSATAGTGVVVGSQTGTLSVGGLGSNTGLSIYVAPADSVVGGMKYVNSATGSNGGVSLQFMLAASSGSLASAGDFRLVKDGTWTSGSGTTQNAYYAWLLRRDGAVSEAMRLTSKGDLTLRGMTTGGGVGVFGMLDATTAPTSTPAGGSILWSTAGVLKTRSSFDALGGFYVNGTQVVTPTGTLAPGSVANAAAFAAGIKPVEVWTYATLPVSGGSSTVYFVTDWPIGSGFTVPSLARWNGSAYVRLVDTSELTGTIAASQIAAGAITAGKLAADAVTAGSIAAGAVTATAINVSTLSSISVNAGTITAGLLQNAAGTRYLDLSAGTANFLQHERLSLLHNGTALFSGTVKLTVANANTLEFWNGLTNVANLSTSVYGSGSTVNLSFPNISRSLAISAQLSTVYLANVDAGGSENGSVSIGTDIILGCNGTLMLQLTSGASRAIGFFGSSGTGKQTLTGAKAGNVALANLIGILAGHGLLTDSTT